MKEIIYNYDNLEEREMNKLVERAKILIVNSKDEIMLAYSHKNYFLVGGHVEENESLEECLKREVKEETGIDLPDEERKPFFVIKYLCKDYPNKSDNTKYITSYFSIKSDLQPDMSQVELTESEKEGSFHLEFIPKDEIVTRLEESLSTCTKEVVVRDTLDAVKEYLKISK